MKYVVVEIKDNYVVALSENGDFSKVKNQNYSLGEVLIMKENNTRKISRKTIAAIASIAAVIALGAGSAFAYYTPVSYVSLDVNPSVEYAVNMFDQVIGVDGVRNNFV